MGKKCQCNCQCNEQCHNHDPDHNHVHSEESFHRQLLITVFVGILTIIAVILENSSSEYQVPVIVLSIVVLAITAFPIFKEAVVGLLNGKRNVNELVSIAIIGCILLSEFVVAAEVAVILTIGELVESWAYARSGRDIRKIIEGNPVYGHKIIGDTIEEVRVSEIIKGDLVLVRPGDVVPVDGTVIEGRSDLDESCLTGESLPVEKDVSDKVYSGSINYNGTLKIRADADAEDSTLGNIVKLVSEAGQRRPPTMLMINRFSRYYSPVILIIAAIVILLTRDPIRAVTVLVVACPCALLLATPSAVIAAVGYAAKQGILVKGGEFLEACQNISVVLFDKTGTLTGGNMEVSAIDPYNCSEEELLFKAGIAESASSHPIAKAIIKECKKTGLNLICNGENVMDSGLGIRAVCDGSIILVGSRQFLSNNGISIREGSTNGQMKIFVACDGRFLGSIYLNDEIRPESFDTIESIRKSGISKIGMVTGDSGDSVKKIAKAAGLLESMVRSGVLPDEKCHIIEEYQKNGEKVCYIGDGTNDGPALAMADIGVAIGSRSDTVALKTSHVVLMREGLSRLPMFFDLGRRTNHVIIENLVMALVFSFVMIIAASVGLLPPALGAVGHQIATVAVLFNSVRLSVKKSYTL